MRVRVMPKAQYLLGTPRWWRLASPRAFGGYLKDLSPTFGAFWRFRSPGNGVCFSRRRRSLFPSRITSTRTSAPELSLSFAELSTSFGQRQCGTLYPRASRSRAELGCRKSARGISASAFASRQLSFFHLCFYVQYLVSRLSAWSRTVRSSALFLFIYSFARGAACNSIPSPPRHVVLCAVFRHLAASRLSLALPTGIASQSSPLLLAYLLWQSRHFSRRCRQGAVRRQGAACYVCEPCVGKLLGRVSAMNYRVLASNWALFRQRFGPRVGRILRRVSTRTWAMCRQRIYQCVDKNFEPCVGKN